MYHKFSLNSFQYPLIKYLASDKDKLFEFAQSSQQENWKTAVYTLNRTLELITDYAICTLGFKKVILEDNIVLLKEGEYLEQDPLTILKVFFHPEHTKSTPFVY